MLNYKFYNLFYVAAAIQEPQDIAKYIKNNLLINKSMKELASELSQYKKFFNVVCQDEQFKMNLILFGVKDTKIIGCLWYICLIFYELEQSIITFNKKKNNSEALDQLLQNLYESLDINLLLMLNEMVILIYQNPSVSENIRRIFEKLSRIANDFIKINILCNLIKEYKKDAIINNQFHEIFNDAMKYYDYQTITNKDQYDEIVAKFRKQFNPTKGDDMSLLDYLKNKIDSILRIINDYNQNQEHLYFILQPYIQNQQSATQDVSRHLKDLEAILDDKIPQVHHSSRAQKSSDLGAQTNKNANDSKDKNLSTTSNKKKILITGGIFLIASVMIIFFIKHKK
jgi:hypothetical protein